MNENELRKQILVGKTECLVFAVKIEMKSVMEQIADKKHQYFFAADLADN